MGWARSLTALSFSLLFFFRDKNIEYTKERGREGNALWEMSCRAAAVTTGRCARHIRLKGYTEPTLTRDKRAVNARAIRRSCLAQLLRAASYYVRLRAAGRRKAALVPEEIGVGVCLSAFGIPRKLNVEGRRAAVKL